MLINSNVVETILKHTHFQWYISYFQTADYQSIT